MGACGGWHFKSRHSGFRVGSFSKNTRACLPPRLSISQRTIRRIDPSQAQLAEYLAKLTDTEMQDASSEPLTLWDRQQALPLGQNLTGDDPLLLLTPVVIPVDNPPHQSKDPFESLGRVLADSHPAVRHVPYTKRGGITATHEAFVRRCRVIIFVMSGPPGDDEPSQADMALSVLSLCHNAVFVVIACFDTLDYDLPVWNLPTVVQTKDYHAESLRAAAGLVFSDSSPTPYPAFQEVSEVAPRWWHVEACELHHDLATIHGLWHDHLPDRFRLSQDTLGSLLTRDACLCLVVKQQSLTGEVLGFCIFFTEDTTFSQTYRFGSLAAIVVRKQYRGRGIGRSLHDAGVRVLVEGSGIHHLRLGSTFPRLLYSMPTDCRYSGWFARRGWHADAAPFVPSPEASDWLLEMNGAPERGLSMAGLSFRYCTPADRDQVLHLVSKVSKRKGYLGWPTQYIRIVSSQYMSDIIIGFEGATAVSAAILYIPSQDHPLADSMPWTQMMNSDVGGLSCICIIGTLAPLTARQTS